MHYAALVILFLSLADAPPVAASAALVDDSAPVPPTPDDFRAVLEAPAPLENVQAVVDFSDGVNLEVNYNLRGVGVVSFAVHTDDAGSGLGLVAVGETVVAELRFDRGAVAWETTDFSALSPAQSHAVAASIMQVWDENVVTEALTVATVDRDFKCKVAGTIAGATAGIMVGVSCGIFFKSPTGCGKAAGTAGGYVGFHITNKCNGAQRH
jgi:hypothetical protein